MVLVAWLAFCRWASWAMDFSSSTSDVWDFMASPVLFMPWARSLAPDTMPVLVTELVLSRTEVNDFIEGKSIIISHSGFF